MLANLIGVAYYIYLWFNKILLLIVVYSLSTENEFKVNIIHGVKNNNLQMQYIFLAQKKCRILSA